MNKFYVVKIYVNIMDKLEVVKIRAEGPGGGGGGTSPERRVGVPRASSEAELNAEHL